MDKTTIIKTLISVSVVGVLLSLSLFAANFSSIKEEVVIMDDSAINTREVVVSERTLDTDNDGIPDFEERLRGTDPQTPNSVPQNSFDYENEDTQGDITEYFANLFGKPTPKENPKIDEPVLLQKQEPVDPARVYGNIMGKIITQYLGGESNETALFTAVIENQTTATLMALGSIVNKYSEVSEDLASVEGVEEAQILHEDLVSTYSNHAKAVETIKSIDIDENIDWLPYIADVKASALALIELAKWFRDNDIVFTSDEDGYIFTQIAHK
ncbi:hypothetical protein COB55_00640 [Candidatus Wolfebacteria bacterium]|nr:MAG: hypothetical protein COB55_00640 [Candidatus Wolfebacteria bacterium]